ncbi:hypothetical protein [Actinoallomurus vinaceus]|uniref:hypothetical protein n=1 Tax=Actinoallomurus vinaceus TaxID=1080074 RepID=UPI0031EED726
MILTDTGASPLTAGARPDGHRILAWIRALGAVLLPTLPSAQDLPPETADAASYITGTKSLVVDAGWTVIDGRFDPGR